MLSDESLLSAVPDFISVGGLLKATPREEAGRRFIWFEASNEDVDHQNEVVLQKALADSADYYLRHGNIDLSHYTLLGPKSGIPNFMEYEIGKPAAVQVNGKKTFVKAELYQGESPMARNANMVWDSLTKQFPVSSWFPSVGGSVLAKSVKLDPSTGEKVGVVDRVRWNNVALDRCPVNKSVPEVSLAPVGVFAKSLGGFIISKALTAGYGSDSAAMTGGAALRGQSLDGAMRGYFKWRDDVSGAIRDGTIRTPNAEGIVAFSAKKFGMQLHEAAEWTERFLLDLKAGMTKRRIK